MDNCCELMVNAG